MAKIDADAALVAPAKLSNDPGLNRERPSSFLFPGLMHLACWMFGLSMLLAIFSARCLYGDGAHEFIRVLQAGTFVELMWVRGFAFDLYELFLVAAIKLGVTDMHLLRLAFGLGCFLPWPLALFICHRLAPEHFWVAVLACAAGYLNAAFMPVGEHILAHACFWTALFPLLFVRPLTPAAALVLLSSAAILCRSYESLLFLGPPLAALALWRGARSGENRWQRLVLLLAAGLFLLAAGIALGGVLYPEIPANFGGFRRGVLAELFAPNWTLAWSSILLLLMVAVCGSPTIRQLVSRPASVWLLGCGLILWSAWPLLAPGALNPVSQHHARFLDLLIPLMLLTVALVLAKRPAWLAVQRPYLVRFSAAMLLAQSLWHLAATWQWQGYVGIVRGVLASRTGPIRLAATPFRPPALDGQALRFDWFWANPCLSLALSPEGRVRSLILSPWEPVWQPFDPLKPRELPDLSRYGIEYSRYLAALPTSSGANPTLAQRATMADGP